MTTPVEAEAGCEGLEEEAILWVLLLKTVSHVDEAGVSAEGVGERTRVRAEVVALVATKDEVGTPELL